MTPNEDRDDGQQAWESEYAAWCAEQDDEDEINRRLVGIMKHAFDAVWQTAQEHQVSLRTATFIVACQRILHAREMRGLYP